MNDQLLTKEQKIRRLVVANREKLGKVNREHVKERLGAEKQTRYEKIKTLNKKSVDHNERLTQQPINQEIPPNITSPELAVNNKTTKPEIANANITDKQALEISKRIKVNNTPLEQLYKEGRINLYQLREAVYEYLQGGQYERVILKHLQAATMEQDPFNNPAKLPEASLPTDLPPLNQPDGLNQTEDYTNLKPASQESIKYPKPKKQSKTKKSDIPAAAKYSVGFILIVIVGALAAALGFWLLNVF